MILTDSSCDLPASLADEMGVQVLPLSITLNGNQYANYLDGRDISFKAFYDRLRSGESCSTSAVNITAFLDLMERYIADGYDILYLGFSSALSGTYGAGETAAEMLRTKYPDRTILTIDTLCASLGQGMLVYLAAQEQKKGKSIEEVYSFVESQKLHLCHWFTVDDLQFLKRGGRISSTAAVLGSILQVKPVLHVDNAGRLINRMKVRGRRASLIALADRMAETAINPGEQTIFISHGDCEEDAKTLADLIRKRMNIKDVIINYVGPVIGAHAGPGVVALFFVGTAR